MFQSNKGDTPPRKYPNHIVRLPIYLAMTLIIGVLVGATMGEKGAMANSIGENVNKFRQILNNIDRLYVDTVDIDKMAEAAMAGMLKKLDPHSIYIPKKDSKYELSNLKGGFDGVGVTYYIYRDTLCIQQTVDGGPSEKAGIKQGDRLVEVEGEPFAGRKLTNKYISDRLRGNKGSTVNIGIKRMGIDSVMHFSIVRDKIPTKDVSVSYIVDDHIGYVKLDRFGVNSGNEVKSALGKLRKKGMKKLILDLRNNGGGYLSEAISIADQFISGKKLIVYTKSKRKASENESFASMKGKFEKGSMIVLVNENSASASEIVAGSLQDHDRALIVGRRTFGKGLVQQPIKLDDGSRMRLTISRYYTPSGRCIQKPYKLGEKDAYYEDLGKRYKSGEYFHADSIHLNEEDRFETDKGRIVYGGGGIMPDVFVAKDTSWYTKYTSKLFKTEVLTDFAISEVQKNEPSLRATGLEAFLQSYQVSEGQLQAIFDKASNEHGMKMPSGETLVMIKTYLQTRLKAEIGKMVWQNDGFYPIYHHKDNDFQSALQMFNKAEALSR